MANVPVRNNVTGGQGNKAAKRTRYEKMETAYGKILAAGYAVGDTLQFVDPPMKELVHARFVGNDKVLEVFHGADLSSALAFDIEASGAAADISYVIHYKKGTGKQRGPTDVAGDGVFLQVTVSSTTP